MRLYFRRIKKNHLLRLLLIIIVFLIPLGTFSQNFKPIPGERIDYLVSLGVFNAGKASMITDTITYNLNDNEVFKIDVIGRTIGIFDFFAKVRDNWGAYITTSDLKPKRFHRYLQEGKYRKNEILNFQNDSDSVQIVILDKLTKDFVEHKYLHFENDIQKIIRSYFMNYWIASLAYLRSLDYSDVSDKELVEIPYFENNDRFKYQMKFLKRESIQTKIGEINSIVFAPLIPKNRLFEDEDAVKFWLSDDKNKVPLKLLAKMNFGNFLIEIENYKNVN